MADWSRQLYWEDVEEGTPLPEVAFPLTVHRLVVQAGAGADYAPIHHNPDVARAQGAPDIYANNVFLMGMWERAVREFIGCGGTIRRLGPFRMARFTLVGRTATVRGSVVRTWREDGRGLLELALRTSISGDAAEDGAGDAGGDTVIGTVLVTLPTRGPDARSAEDE